MFEETQNGTRKLLASGFPNDEMTAEPEERLIEIEMQIRKSAPRSLEGR